MNRIADVLFEPLLWALLLLALSYVLRRRMPRASFTFPALALGLLVVLSVPAVSNHLERELEHPALTTMKDDVTYDAVIVLGGAMNATITRETGRPSFNEAAERVLTGFDLLRTGRAKNAILTGSRPVGADAETKSEARLMADQLEAWGIDPSRLALDERATNTHENAVETARIARERGWTRDLLVTSASHMPRALGCFRREGFPVDTLSVDFHSADPAKNESAWLPRAGALAVSTTAIREWVGRIVYRVRGFSE